MQAIKLYRYLTDCRHDFTSRICYSGRADDNVTSMNVATNFGSMVVNHSLHHKEQSLRTSRLPSSRLTGQGGMACGYSGTGSPGHQHLNICVTIQTILGMPLSYAQALVWLDRSSMNSDFSVPVQTMHKYLSATVEAENEERNLMRKKHVSTT